MISFNLFERTFELVSFFLWSNNSTSNLFKVEFKFLFSAWLTWSSIFILFNKFSLQFILIFFFCNSNSNIDFSFFKLSMSSFNFIILFFIESIALFFSNKLFSLCSYFLHWVSYTKINFLFLIIKSFCSLILSSFNFFSLFNCSFISLILNISLFKFLISSIKLFFSFSIFCFCSNNISYFFLYSFISKLFFLYLTTSISFSLTLIFISLFSFINLFICSFKFWFSTTKPLLFLFKSLLFSSKIPIFLFKLLIVSFNSFINLFRISLSLFTMFNLLSLILKFICVFDKEFSIFFIFMFNSEFALFNSFNELSFKYTVSLKVLLLSFTFFSSSCNIINCFWRLKLFFSKVSFTFLISLKSESNKSYLFWLIFWSNLILSLRILRISFDNCSFFSFIDFNDIIKSLFWLFTSFKFIFNSSIFLFRFAFSVSNSDINIFLVSSLFSADWFIEFILSFNKIFSFSKLILILFILFNSLFKFFISSFNLFKLFL